MSLCLSLSPSLSLVGRGDGVKRYENGMRGPRKWESISEAKKILKVL